MKEQIDRSLETDQVKESAAVQKQSLDHTPSFYNERPEVSIQRQIQKKANSSTRGSVLKTIQAKADGGVIQRLEDSNGDEITEERVKNENDIKTLNSWEDLCDWDDDILSVIQDRIAVISKSKEESKEKEIDEEETKPEVKSKPVVESKPKKEKSPKPERPPKPVAPPGYAFYSTVDKGAGTNKTRSWKVGKSEYPHITVVLGDIDQARDLVLIKDFHYSKGQSDTHLYWDRKSGNRYEFRGDVSNYTPHGKEMVSKTYQKIVERAKKLGDFEIIKPPGI